jgi:prophage DNA circulation protein
MRKATSTDWREAAADKLEQVRVLIDAAMCVDEGPEAWTLMNYAKPEIAQALEKLRDHMRAADDVIGHVYDMAACCRGAAGIAGTPLAMKALLAQALTIIDDLATFLDNPSLTAADKGDSTPATASKPAPGPTANASDGEMRRDVALRAAVAIDALLNFAEKGLADDSAGYAVRTLVRRASRLACIQCSALSDDVEPIESIAARFREAEETGHG